jgi:tRNA1(Val) A37 N6-methylase TrmN6
MAFFMVFDNIRGSLKYGSGTFGSVDLKKLTIINGEVQKSSRYEPVSFHILEKLFDAFKKISDNTSIIDLGCGKGRMMMVAPYFGFTNITGIDFAKELCQQAIINMEKKEQQFPHIHWQVINENVEQHEINSNDSVFFMFNPFDEDVLMNFLKKLEVSCTRFPRQVYFLYASPQYQKLLLNKGYAIIYHKQKMYLESIIAVKDY